ncbi:MAG: response regulator [Candidatus Saccharibacteria bacterium]
MIKKILYIDSNHPIAQMYYSALKSSGYQIELATTGTDGLLAARNNQYDLILMDINLIEHSGAEIVQSLRGGSINLIPDSDIIILTNTDPDESFKDIAEAYLIKSETTPDKLISIIQQL